MANRLSKDEFEKLWRRWLPLCSEPVKSESGNPYHSFGRKDSELIAAFALLITILKNEYGYEEDDMDSAGKITIEHLSPKLAWQTTKTNEEWKRGRKNKFDMAMEQIFGQDSDLSKKYKIDDFKRDVRVAEPEQRRAEEQKSSLPFRPPIPENVGYDVPEDIETEEIDILKELGVKK